MISLKISDDCVEGADSLSWSGQSLLNHASRGYEVTRGKSCGQGDNLVHQPGLENRVELVE